MGEFASLARRSELVRDKISEFLPVQMIASAGIDKTRL
jgi:hypothetical protein